MAAAEGSGGDGRVLTVDGMGASAETSLPDVMASPVRKRLDSPVAKGMSRTPLRQSLSEEALNNNPGSANRDSTIMGLKERLARLRSERSEQPAAIDPSS